MKEKKISRQEYNRMILEKTKDNQIFMDYADLYNFLEDAIEKCPQQRWGQILANYVITDYRNKDISSFSKGILNIYFNGYSGDIFFEESSNTYGRLIQK